MTPIYYMVRGIYGFYFADPINRSAFQTDVDDDLFPWIVVAYTAAIGEQHIIYTVGN